MSLEKETKPYLLNLSFNWILKCLREYIADEVASKETRYQLTFY